ncbi:MAG TPA: TonB-dependent receptor [Thermoguttaceae bacterium]|nr:TonB-dependent receptor [Thermoguttaceae bacterium]
MAARRIAYACGAAILTAVFFSGLFQPTTLGQSPDAGIGNSTAGQTDKKNESEDDLDLLDVDLKELSSVAVKSGSTAMDAEVSSVTRTKSTVAHSPAAVYVLTNEMIKRSGARNIPEALRLVPGVNVARTTNSAWAISIRGFNGKFGNKLLVQIDGRAVYTPAFGGVWWDMQQVLLEDVERIEIVRGPGGAVWGANAVNGVINIVTKSSAATQGIYAQSGGGDEHRSFNALRAGGQQGDLTWRMYGLQADDGPSFWNGPGAPWDAFQCGQGGFRMDWTPTRRDTLTLQGDFLGTRGTCNQNFGTGFLPGPERTRGSNFLGRWSRVLDENSDWAVQMYYYNWHRRVGGDAPWLMYENTFDLDCQQHTKLNERNDLVYGFGYRNSQMMLFLDGAGVATVPPTDSLGVISYFVQDTMTLRDDLLYTTVGVKCEHNSYTGFEYQPCAKLLLTPNEQTSMWGSISRAVRVPSFGERNAQLFGGLFRGNQTRLSEDVLAYELGMRRQATEKFYWDLAVFFNRYDNLIGISPAIPPGFFTNVGYGDTYGYELVGTYEVTPDWRLSTSYSFLVEHITYGPNGLPLECVPGRSPRNQWNLQSGWNLPHDTTLDVIFRYVDMLENGNLPSYFVMDVRWAWYPTDSLELAVVGQNLLDSPHQEFLDNFGEATEVEQGVYGSVSWRH